MGDFAPPTKAELLDRIGSSRAHLESLLPGLSEEKLSEPFTPEGWSIKDQLVHIAAWERFAIGRLEAAFGGHLLEGRLLLANTDFDRMNALVFDENKDRPFTEVRQDFDAAHREMLSFLENLGEDSLAGEIPAEWAEGRPVWAMIAGNTFGHYEEHSETIEAWLNG